MCFVINIGISLQDMKKSGHIIILLILAAVVFYTGTGVTIMKYCCPDCEPSYAIVGQKHTCHNQDESSDTCAMPVSCPNCGDAEPDRNMSSYKVKGGGCASTRVSVDLDSQHYRPQMQIPVVWLSIMNSSSLWGKEEPAKAAEFVSYPESPPTIVPRSYLSLIRVLII